MQTLHKQCLRSKQAGRIAVSCSLCQAYPRIEREQHEEVYRGAEAPGCDSVETDGTAS